jgi:tetratricopeptide (TPR) repeat protein
MKHSYSVALGARLLLAGGLVAFALSGCQRHLGSYLKAAHKTFAEKNYVDTIDDLNTGLNYWQKSEGLDKKAEAYELLGKSHRALRNVDKALDAYQQAAKISQTRFDVYYDMASIYLAKDFAEQAERNFREALRVKPDDPLSLLGLGNSLYAQHKNDEARAAFQRIIETSPGVKDALDSLAAMGRSHKTAAVAASKPASPTPRQKRRKSPAKKIQRSRR